MIAVQVIHVTTGEGTATWVVAIATVALFTVTGLLFLATRGMVRTSARQVAIETGRITAAQQPHVYPVTLDPWVVQAPPYDRGRSWQVIPLANAGPGIAHNTTGILQFGDGVFVPIHPLTIQPGQTLDARFDWGGVPREDGWRNAHGFLVYDDVAGQIWLTEYSIRESNQRLFFEFAWSGPLSEFGSLYDRFRLAPGTVVMRGEMTNTLDRALRASLNEGRPG